MSNLLHKVKDAVTGHHHGKESKDSSKRQHGTSSGAGASGSNPNAEYTSNTGEYGGSSAGHQGPTEYGSQPTAGQYGSGTGEYSSQAETYGPGRSGVGGSAPGGSSYTTTQPGSGQYTEGTRGYDSSKVGSHMESDPRHVAGGTQQQRSQW